VGDWVCEVVVVAAQPNSDVREGFTSNLCVLTERAERERERERERE